MQVSYFSEANTAELQNNDTMKNDEERQQMRNDKESKEKSRHEKSIGFSYYNIS